MNKVVAKNAYMVRSANRRLEISSIVAQTEIFTNRSTENFVFEWKVRNIGFYFPSLRSHAIDADWEYGGDDREEIRFITAIFDILGEE